MRKYFGTDGIRGQVGELPMTPEFALRLGWAAGVVLARDAADARVLIGKDTRRSGYMLESALEAGLAAAGVEAYLLGPLPTAGVAYLTRALRAQAGIVISASHNPHHDNGLKFFSAEGDKLPDELEAAIEAQLEQPMCCVPSERMGRARRVDDAVGRYIEFCKSTFSSRSLHGLRLVVDCANGAAYKAAPAVLSELGAEVHVLANTPDGFNINRNCGSMHPQALQARVREVGADAGIALDGDADRCLMVGADGRLLDGDDLLLAIARRRHAQGRLHGPVVGTLMSNLALERAVQAMGVPFERAAVGDRHVLSRLRALGGVVGGETSGHILCLDVARTGDGIVTALQVLEAARSQGCTPGELVADLHKFPQVLLNVAVRGEARACLERPELRTAESRARQALGSRGRILLRASGTEPLIRVMVEADDAELAETVAGDLAGVVREITTGIPGAA